MQLLPKDGGRQQRGYPPWRRTQSGKDDRRRLQQRYVFDVGTCPVREEAAAAQMVRCYGTKHANDSYFVLSVTLL